MLDSVSSLTYEIAQRWGGYAPHAICLLYDPAILAVEVVANLGVALAYFIIPFAIWRFLRRVEMLPFRSVLVMFVVFILACGTSHLTRVATLFLGGAAYWVDAAVCLVTLVASLGTAIGLVRHGPRIVILASRMLAGAR
jgi:ascorbate-specific PTS system EIIC-type component UlaA